MWGAATKFCGAATNCIICVKWYSDNNVALGCVNVRIGSDNVLGLPEPAAEFTKRNVMNERAGSRGADNGTEARLGYDVVHAVSGRPRFCGTRHLVQRDDLYG